MSKKLDWEGARKRDKPSEIFKTENVQPLSTKIDKRWKRKAMKKRRAAALKEMSIIN